MFTVYALVDPRDDTTRYVGISNEIYARFSQHVRCEGNNLAKNAWIQELKEDQVMVIMRSLEVVEDIEQAKEREEYWINHFLKTGVRLFNQYIPRTFSFDDFLIAMGKKDEPDLSEEYEAQAGLNGQSQVQKSTKYFMTFEEASVYTGYAVSTLVRQLRVGEIEANRHGDKLKVSTLKVKSNVKLVSAK